MRPAAGFRSACVILAATSSLRRSPEVTTEWPLAVRSRARRDTYAERPEPSGPSMTMSLPGSCLGAPGIAFPRNVRGFPDCLLFKVSLLQ